MRPSLSFPNGQSLASNSIHKPDNQENIFLEFCLTDNEVVENEAILRVGHRTYPVQITLDQEADFDGWSVTDPNRPSWAIVHTAHVDINEDGELVITFSVANSNVLEFGLSPTIQLSWHSNLACGFPEPFERRYTLGLTSSALTLDRVEDGKPIPQLPPERVETAAVLSGDYCSNDGVTLKFVAENLRVDTSSNLQEFFIVINLSSDINELFEEDDMQFFAWKIEFEQDNILGEASHAQ